MHREVIVPIRVNRRVVDEKALRSAIVFVLLYLLTFAVGALGLVADARRAGEDLDAFEAFGAAAACLGNVGPGVRVRRAVRLVRTLQRLLDLDLHRADVAWPGRDHSRSRRTDPRLLALVTRGTAHGL